MVVGLLVRHCERCHQCPVLPLESCYILCPMPPSETTNKLLCVSAPFVTSKPPTESSCSTPSGPQTPRRRARRRGRRLVICHRAAPRLLRCRKLAATQSATHSLFLSIAHCYLLPSSWLPTRIYREIQGGGGSTMRAEAFFPRVSQS